MRGPKRPRDTVLRLKKSLHPLSCRKLCILLEESQRFSTRPQGVILHCRRKKYKTWRHLFFSRRKYLRNVLHKIYRLCKIKSHVGGKKSPNPCIFFSSGMISAYRSAHLNIISMALWSLTSCNPKGAWFSDSQGWKELLLEEEEHGIIGCCSSYPHVKFSPANYNCGIPEARTLTCVGHVSWPPEKN